MMDRAGQGHDRAPSMHGPGMPGRMGGFGGRHRAGLPVERPKRFWRTLRRLWVYVGAERPRLIATFGAVLGTAAVGLAAPYLLGRIVDALAGGMGTVDFERLLRLVAVLGGVYVGEAAANFAQNFLVAGVSQRVVERLRRALFDKLQSLPISFFDARTHGELMSGFTNDIENVSGTIAQATVQLMAGSLAIAGSLVMMLLLSPLLTLASLVTVPLVVALVTAITERTLPLFREQQAILGRLNGHVEETMSGLHVVKAFNHEQPAIAQFEEHNARLREVGTRAQIWSGYIMPLMNVINNLGFAVIAGVGGVMAVRGMTSVGVIASFLGYSRQFSRPLNELSSIYNLLQSAVAGAERVFEVLDEREEAQDPPDALTLADPRGHVAFDSVSFGYRPDAPVLSGVTFSAPAGSTTALVGPTGAGKTTIVNLLARFYEVSAGRILIEGHDIRRYTRDSLRRCFGIVLQDTCLFSGTIRENIRYGRLEASDSDVEAAAVAANASDFIRRLPHGYDTVLGEGGGSLSQGERQLLAIARALLADPAILILDEATSSVDTRTELRIQAATRTLMRGRTSFIIAHRLSTIRDADMIMVIERGRIIQRGHHRELLEQPGVYRSMWLSQFANAAQESEGGGEAPCGGTVGGLERWES